MDFMEPAALKLNPERLTAKTHQTGKTDRGISGGAESHEHLHTRGDSMVC